MEPTLYILMRSDIPDMNPGKAMAQAAHAQADFDTFIEDNCGPDYTQENTLLRNVCTWKEDRSFGRTIVLEATREKMREVINNCTYGDHTIDPTYPWRNYYDKMFVTQELTCSWVFICEANALDTNLIADLELHK